MSQGKGRIDLGRRRLIVELAGAAALPATLAHATPTAPAPAASPRARGLLPAGAAATGVLPADWPRGSRDPADPDLVSPELLWDKLLDADERATTAALCDVILPADARSPAASALGVHDFVDEWVSAPYPQQIADRQVIRGGLAWLNTEADRRHGRRFVALSPTEKAALCDDIADEEGARPAFLAGARFFARVRHLAMLGYYTTAEGMADLGYIGNVALTEWKGAPLEILRRLGLEPG